MRILGFEPRPQTETGSEYVIAEIAAYFFRKISQNLNLMRCHSEGFAGRTRFCSRGAFM